MYSIIKRWNNNKNDKEQMMTKNNFKQNNMDTPIENHKTAAWSNEEKYKKISKVNIPNTIQVKNAKEYVDTNQK